MVNLVSLELQEKPITKRKSIRRVMLLTCVASLGNISQGSILVQCLENLQQALPFY